MKKRERKKYFLANRFSSHGRFFWLLTSLVLSLTISVFIYHHVLLQWFYVFLILFVLISAILTVRESRRFVIFLIIVAVFTFLFNLSDLIITDAFSEFCSKLFLAVFCTILVICFSKDILKSKTITHDVFFGAICVYILIAITFGLLYNMINIIDPQSFYMISLGKRALLSEFDFFYFSFTTLTTVGYGDVAIVTAHAKALVVVESITGIFYLAILVSRLVTRYSKKMVKKRVGAGKSGKPPVDSDV